MKAKGYIDASVSRYRMAINLKSDLSSAWLNLGVALASLDREEEAIAAYEVLDYSVCARVRYPTQRLKSAF